MFRFESNFDRYKDRCRHLGPLGSFLSEKYVSLTDLEAHDVIHMDPLFKKNCM